MTLNVDFERAPSLDVAVVAAPKRFVTIPGGDRSDLSPPDLGRCWDAVDLFVETGRRSAG